MVDNVGLHKMFYFFFAFLVDFLPQAFTAKFKVLGHWHFQIFLCVPVFD